MGNKRATDDPRGNLFLGDPERMVIITDQAHPLYDPRIEKPLTDAFIASLDVQGVLEPVVCRKELDQLVVMAGRRRVRGAREVNKRRKARGERDLLRVPYVTKRSNDAEAIGIMIAENEHREDDDLIGKATKAARAIDRNVAKKDVALTFGVEEATIDMWLKLRDCIPKVQEMVQEKRLRIHDVVRKIAKLPPSEQMPAAMLLAASAPTRKTRKENGQPAKASKGVSMAARLKLLTKEDNWEKLGIKEQLLVGWIIGEKTQGDLAQAYPRLAQL
jgi:ParB family chromosome partitioning protein